MTELNLYNQYNNPLLNQGKQPSFSKNSPYSPNMQGVPPSMQGLDYDTLKSQAEYRAQNNALAQATKDYDILEHPFVAAKNLALSLIMAITGTSLTNRAIVSKKIAQGATNFEDFQNSRLYKWGYKIDNSTIGRSFEKISSATKGFASKIPVPGFVKDIFNQIKIGGIAVPDTTGMFSRGKGCEALIEAVTDLGKVSRDELGKLFTNPADKNAVFKILDEVKAGKLHQSVAFSRLDKYISKLPADKLEKLFIPYVPKQGGLIGWFSKLGNSAMKSIDKVPNMKQNINMAWHKARIFNGGALNASQGAITKALQKTFAYIGEATGNGVLGGKAALIMGGAALMTGFNAASKTVKGDKLPAFMEDYIGFTLGSYIMSFIVGTWFNKFLGVTELGMDKSKIVELGKRLGLDMSDPKEVRLQSVVMAYNNNFKELRKINDIADELRSGKIDLAAAQRKAISAGVEGAEKCLTKETLLNKIVQKVGGKDNAFFDTIRKDIKDVYKSNLSLKSVFEKTGKGSESFFGKLGKYILHKPLSFIGKTLSIGRYDLIHGNKFSAKSIAKFSKRFGFGFARAILVMFVLVEPFRKGFMKLSHKIFGKPIHSELDEEENANKETEKANNAPATVPTVQPKAASGTNILENMINKPKQPAAPAMSGSLLSSFAKKQTAAASPIAAAKTAPETDLSNQLELKRSYIPSSDPSPYAMQKSPGEVEAEHAIAMAEAAERRVQDFLSNHR